MPRTARIKLDNGIYHIMIRSIPEILLFKENEDKDKYISLIRKYQKIFMFKLYAYCFMDNHAHFLINSNGKDISKIMHCINQCYSMYYNRKYARRGHVFADRFKSVLIKDDKQLFCTSAYIHNNPKDIAGYKNSVEKYKHSSLRIYLNAKLDLSGIVDSSLILGLLGNNISSSKLKYFRFVKSRTGNDIENEMEFISEQTQYISGRHLLLPTLHPNDIIEFIKNYTKENFNIHIKYHHKNSELKSICVLLLRSICNYSHKEICKVLGNTSISNISILCNKGLSLILNKHVTLINDLLVEYAS